MKDVVIVGAVRTAVGTYGGSLMSMPSYELGGMVIKELLQRTGLETNAVDEVIFGCAYQTSHYLNCARQALFRAGLPVSIPAYTVDRQCASGLQALCEGVMLIQTGQARIVVAGGAENMSGLPYLIDSARWGYRLGHGKLYDWFTDAAETVSGPESLFGYCNMGLTASTAKRFIFVNQKILNLQIGFWNEKPFPLPYISGSSSFMQILCFDSHPFLSIFHWTRL